MFTYGESKNRLRLSEWGHLVTSCDGVGVANKWPVYSRNYPF